MENKELEHTPEQFFEYQKGDVVRIRKPSKQMYYEEPPWTDAMDYLEEGEHELIKVLSDDLLILRQGCNSLCWNLHPSWVELVSRGDTRVNRLEQVNKKLQEELDTCKRKLGEWGVTENALDSNKDHIIRSLLELCHRLVS